jgi:enolase-phosphatase E1
VPPIKAVVTDIEGTTSAIAFVRDTLFPFAAAALDGFLDAHARDPKVAAILAEVPGPDRRATLRQWMAEDSKATPLKTLQGLIWRAGYEGGNLRGHLWPDVAGCLRAWAADGIGLAVYSSARWRRSACCSAIRRPATWSRCSAASSTRGSAPSGTPQPMPRSPRR